MEIGPRTIALLVLAGIGAGITGSTAGLASLVSYPALLAIGLPPVTANVTNTVALIGSSIGSVSGSRRELGGQGRDIRRWTGIAIVGGAVGAILLLVGPAGTFEDLVPYLVAGASVLLLFSPRLRAIRAGRSKVPQVAGPEAVGPGGGVGSGAAEPIAPSPSGPLMPIALFLTCLYGGYFGAAAGVMILALLLFATDKTLPAANALKNLLLGMANAVAAVAFSIFADVRWAAVIPLMLGCIVGGAVGPAIVRRVPPTLMRVVIATAGFALAVKLWLG
ncbi:putative membrane protein YfcA [Nakamurella sp. UYEF19]|uniref:sulfite exporter TauE/SafE family protein n=1 Tax=Nakamurella sp. UYEF19 TaxID=1756392 RepID=UPI003393028C